MKKHLIAGFLSIIMLSTSVMTAFAGEMEADFTLIDKVESGLEQENENEVNIFLPDDSESGLSQADEEEMDLIQVYETEPDFNLEDVLEQDTSDLDEDLDLELSPDDEIDSVFYIEEDTEQNFIVEEQEEELETELSQESLESQEEEVAQAESTGISASYWKRLGNNHYYDQLSEDEKYIYDAIDKRLLELLTNKENLINFTQYNDTYYSMYYVVVNVPEGGVTQSLMDKLTLALMYDRPQYFFFNRIFYRDRNSVWLYIYGQYAYGEVRAAESQKIKTQLDKWVKQVNKKKTDPEKLEYIYSLICDYTSYYTWDTSKKNPTYVNRLAGPVLYGSANCAGYASTFMSLANLAGFDSMCVGSAIPGRYGHEWNQVKINNYWYVVDATWGDSNNKKTYNWFLISQKTADAFDDSGNHSKRYFDKGFTIPEAKKDYSKAFMINKKDLKPIKLSSQESYTPPIPDIYETELYGNQGTLETVYYNTKDYYKKDGKKYRKKAIVYLPYGYKNNKSKKYPILYYMHGTFDSEDIGGPSLKKYFDNMIADGWIQPMIVVYPTFYTNNDSKDYVLGFHNQDVYSNEFNNDLMKAVEGKYRTYAKSTSKKDLKSSRNYRAFTGYSAGGVTTWNIFLESAEYVKYYIPLAGDVGNKFDNNNQWIPRNVLYEKAINQARKLKKQGLKYKIIDCCGTVDKEFTVKVRAHFKEFTKYQSLFSKDKYMVLWTKGGQHDARAFKEGLFTALPLCFPGKNYK